MSNQKLMLDLGDLAMESIEVAPATSLDSATYGHGMPEFAASCINLCSSCCFMPDELDEV